MARRKSLIENLKKLEDAVVCISLYVSTPEPYSTWSGAIPAVEILGEEKKRPYFELLCCITWCFFCLFPWPLSHVFLLLCSTLRSVVTWQAFLPPLQLRLVASFSSQEIFHPFLPSRRIAPTHATSVLSAVLILILILILLKKNVITTVGFELTESALATFEGVHSTTGVAGW